MDDEFGQHGVVRRRDFVALAHAGVQPQPRPCGWTEDRKRPDARKESVGGVFGVNADLNGVTAHGKVRHRHRFSCRNPELLTNEVNARHQFGDRMFDLNAGVHLEEMEGAVILHEEFDRPCPDVIHRLCGGDGSLSHALTLFVVDDRARRLFEHLLMAALDAALSLAQVNGGAVCVGQDLYFDVTRPPQQAFEVHTSVAKGCDGFAPCPAYGLIETVGRFNGAHALSTAACAGLQQQGESNTCRGIAHRGQRGRKVCVLIAGGLDLNFFSGNDRNAGFAHRDASGHLVAHAFDGARGRPNPNQTGIDDRLCKTCTL